VEGMSSDLNLLSDRRLTVWKDKIRLLVGLGSPPRGK